MDIQQISEDFLHYIWKMQKFRADTLSTTNKESIQILSLGQHNHDAGPDFFGAKIKINDTLWVGNVEIHIKSSMWYDHNHHQDPAYNNVILHVVYDHDKEVETQSKNQPPVLEIKDLIDPKVFTSFLGLTNTTHSIPCAPKIDEVSDIIIRSMISTATIERLQNKTKEIKRVFDFTNNDWESTCYILVARYLGAKVNKDPLERLARRTPLTILQKHKNNQEQIEGILFGQSGLLPSQHSHAQVSHWIKEYNFFKSKYNLQHLSLDNWKFSRMRPVAFPTIRISQLANLLYKQDNLFSKILASENAHDLLDLFEVSASSFWDDHYHFNKESEHSTKHLGKSTVDIICINAIAPLLFFYGHSTANQVIKDKAIELLESIKPELNTIIKDWKTLSVIPSSAFESQGLIELKQNYCTSNRCLHCKIGNSVMQL